MLAGHRITKNYAKKIQKDVYKISKYVEVKNIFIYKSEIQ
jgi:hypothetical protein